MVNFSKIHFTGSGDKGPRSHWLGWLCAIALYSFSSPTYISNPPEIRKLPLLSKTHRFPQITTKLTGSQIIAHSNMTSHRKHKSKLSYMTATPMPSSCEVLLISNEPLSSLGHSAYLSTYLCLSCRIRENEVSEDIKPKPMP